MSKGSEPRAWVVVLPSLLTLGNLLCGFLAVARCLAGDTAGAASLVLVGACLDTFDGALARWTRTQSRFGLHLDSLADIVTFGLAPSLWVATYLQTKIGMVGLGLGFWFLAAGALRLARFNAQGSASEHFRTGEASVDDGSVQSGPTHPSSRSEAPAPPARAVGLPIPVAASGLMALGAAYPPAPWWTIALAGVTGGGLMVSRWPFATFKRISRGHRLRGLLVLVPVWAVLIGWAGWFWAIALSAALYVALGFFVPLARSRPGAA